MTQIIREDRQSEQEIVSGGTQQQRRTDVSNTAVRSDGTETMARLIWFIGGVIALLLLLRFVLRLINANPAAGFADFIYTLTAPLASPFINLTGQPTSSAGNAFELGTLIAIAVYLLVTWGIVQLLAILTRRSDVE